MWIVSRLGGVHPDTYSSQLVEVGDLLEERHEAIEKSQTVVTQSLVLIHDQHRIEERVDRAAELRKNAKCSRVVPNDQRLSCRLLGLGECIGKRRFLGTHEIDIGLCPKLRRRARFFAREKATDRSAASSRVRNSVRASQRCSAVGRIVVSHCKHRSDGVVGVAASLRTPSSRPTMNSLTCDADLLGGELERFLVALERCSDRVVECDVQTVHDDAEDAERSTTERVGVGRAGRRHADGEDADHRVELVGDRDDGAGRGRRETRHQRTGAGSARGSPVRPRRLS